MPKLPTTHLKVGTTTSSIRVEAFLVRDVNPAQTLGSKGGARTGGPCDRSRAHACGDGVHVHVLPLVNTAVQAPVGIDARTDAVSDARSCLSDARSTRGYHPASPGSCEKNAFDGRGVDGAG